MRRGHRAQAGRAAAAARRTVDVLPTTGFTQRVPHNGATQAGLRAQAHSSWGRWSTPVVVANSLKAVKLLNLLTA
jgi:hypothetical protein